MTDLDREPAVPPKGRAVTADDVLRVVIVVLIATVAAAGSYFGYTVYETRRAESQATPAQRALAALEAEVRKDPNNAAARVRYGEALAAAGLYERAAEQFRAAIEIDENHTGAWLDLGLVAMRMDDRASAEKHFTRVAELTEGAEFENVNQRRELALFHLGEIALDDRRFEDAAAYFKAALRIRRDSSTTYYLLAQAYHGMGSSTTALEQLDAALAFDPNYAEAHYLYGTILLSEQDRVNAAVHLVKAAELAPDVAAPKEKLASLGTAKDAIARAETALAERRASEAIEEALLARTLDASSVHAGLVHARAAIALGDKKIAAEVLDEVLKLDADNAEAKRLKATL